MWNSLWPQWGQRSGVVFEPSLSSWTGFRQQEWFAAEAKSWLVEGFLRTAEFQTPPLRWTLLMPVFNKQFGLFLACKYLFLRVVCASVHECVSWLERTDGYRRIKVEMCVWSSSVWDLAGWRVDDEDGLWERTESFLDERLPAVTVCRSWSRFSVTLTFMWNYSDSLTLWQNLIVTTISLFLIIVLNVFHSSQQSDLAVNQSCAETLWQKYDLFVLFSICCQCAPSWRAGAGMRSCRSCKTQTLNSSLHGTHLGHVS